MSDPISVVMAADENYAMQLAVAIASIGSKSDTSDYAVHVLHDGIPADVKRRVEVSGEGLGDVEGFLLDTGVLAARRADVRLPLSSLYRLLMPAVLPAELDRVIYLDGDVLVRQDLGPLWHR